MTIALGPFEFTLEIPSRGTTGLVSVADMYGKGASQWEIQHTHESLDIEEILEQLLDNAFSSKSGLSLPSGNNEIFLQMISKLNEASRSSVDKCLGKYFK